MTKPAPPTQASSKTVTSIEVPFLRAVLDLDPTFERDKHDELMYPFGEAGHRARNFYGDPYVSGAYAPPPTGVPVNSGSPFIEGAANVGQTLFAFNGIWAGAPTYPPPSSFVYRWFQNSVPIVGAVSQTYVLTVGDRGKLITVGVEAVNVNGASLEAVSVPIGPVTTGGLEIETSPPPRTKSMSVNRISFVIPSNQAQAGSERDETINKILAILPIGEGGDLYHYVDNSPLAMWAYYFIAQAFIDGIYTIATVYCSGVTNPPSGSNLPAVADPGPGPGNFTWGAVGALPSISVSSGISGGGTAPTGNNNCYVWNIPGSSLNAAADFTEAVGAIAAALAAPITGNFVAIRYLRYVDSVAGGWQMSAIFFGPGATVSGNTGGVTVSPDNNILYVVTCSGSPHPPAGSNYPAASLPSFAQTPIYSLSAPLNFGPTR